MSIKIHIKALPMLFLLVTPIAYVGGQEEHMIIPTDFKQKTIVTEPVTLKKGFLRAGVIFNYRVADKYFDVNRKKQYYLNSTWGTKAAYNLVVQYGITDRFEADLFTDYMRNKNKITTVEIAPGTNTSVSTVTRQIGAGLGDSHLELKYQLVPEEKYLVSLTGIVDATLPTGQKNPTNIRSATVYDLPVGDGTYALSGELFARTIIYPWSFTTYLKYNYNFTGTKKFLATDTFLSRFKPGNRIEAGLSANFHLNEWIVLANELSYYHEAEGWVSRGASTTVIGTSWAAVYTPDLVFQIKKIRVGESVSIPLTGKNVPADPLYIITILYVF